ncbi:hypothetical protein ACQP2E_13375 [Actinoplanes sp. CA-015351]|uniref:hypothetical protein n=1 Tax=Actinoplanes sp. CA-015351 TaxID=3239897 RepID=UPI003D95DDE0
MSGSVFEELDKIEEGQPPLTRKDQRPTAGAMRTPTHPPVDLVESRDAGVTRVNEIGR